MQFQARRNITVYNFPLPQYYQYKSKLNSVKFNVSKQFIGCISTLATIFDDMIEKSVTSSQVFAILFLQFLQCSKLEVFINIDIKFNLCNEQQILISLSKKCYLYIFPFSLTSQKLIFLNSWVFSLETREIEKKFFFCLSEC